MPTFGSPVPTLEDDAAAAVLQPDAAQSLPETHANDDGAAPPALTADDNTAIHRDGDITSTDDGLIFNPFNPENKIITESDIQSILGRYGITAKPDNYNIYKRAFIHSSYVKRPIVENAAAGITVVPCPDDCLPLKTKSNERLEFIGDGVLECIVKYYLYRRFPKEQEGFMTEKKIALVKNEHIGKLAYEMGLGEWFVISKHAEEKGVRGNVKRLGCLFEAFIGALFLDFNKIKISDEHNWFSNVFVTGPGFQMAQIFIENILEQHVDWTKLITENDNYKNVLQVLIQKEFKTTPDYIELSHDPESGYEIGIYLSLGCDIHHEDPNSATPMMSATGKMNTFTKIQAQFKRSGKAFILLGKSRHRTKKKAEQNACKCIIEYLNDV